MRAKAEIARAFVEGFDAADPAIASARAIADEWRSGVDFAQRAADRRLRPMFERLRNACAAAGVRTCTVDGRAADFVAPWVRRGRARGAWGDTLTFRARAAVVTLPVGVLRHSGDDAEIVFDPELPAVKRDALGSIEMGHAVKVALWFRTAFWERIRDGRYRDAAILSLDRAAVRGVLDAVSRAQRADRRVGRRSEGDRTPAAPRTRNSSRARSTASERCSARLN